MTDQDECWGDWKPDSWQMLRNPDDDPEEKVPGGDEEAAAESAGGAAPVFPEEAAPEFAEEAAPDAPPVDVASDPSMVAAPSEAALDPAPMVEAPSTMAAPGGAAADGEVAPASSGRRMRLVRKTNVNS